MDGDPNMLGVDQIEKTNRIRTKGSDLLWRIANGQITGYASNDEEPFVVRELRAKADLYKERNALYGDNYKRFGTILSLILGPNTKLDAGDAEQMNRFGIFVHLVGKLTRYGEQFSRGGHRDSLDDLSVYAMMLAELDEEAKK